MDRNSELPTSALEKGEEKGNRLQKTFNSIFQCLKDQNFNKIYALKQKQSLDKSLRQFFCSLADLCKRYMHLVKIYEQIFASCGDIEAININKFQDSMVKLDISKEDQEKIGNIIDDINLKKQEQIRKMMQQKKKLEKQLSKVKLETNELNLQNQRLKTELTYQKKKISLKDQQLAKIMKQVQNSNQTIVDSIRKIKELEDQTLQLRAERDISLRKLEVKQIEINQINKKKTQMGQYVKKDQSYDVYFKYFIDKTYLLNQIGLNTSISTSFIKEIEKMMDKSIKGFQTIFRLDKSFKRDTFHQQVDGRPNILLICKTREHKILGGFSSFSFDISKTKYSQKELKNQKAFLFNIDKEGLNIFPLKYGFQSIEYDFDFIIFGKEQLSLCRRTGELESSFCNNTRKQNYYQDMNQKRVNFLSDRNRKITKIELLTYQINIIVF